MTKKKNDLSGQDKVPLTSSEEESKDINIESVSEEQVLNHLEVDSDEKNTDPVVSTALDQEKDSINKEIVNQETAISSPIAEEEEDQVEEEIDLSLCSKNELTKLLKEKVVGGDILKSDKLVQAIKTAFDELVQREKDDALLKFKNEGGAETDFEFRQNEEDKEFNNYYFDFKNQIGSIRKETERQKEINFSAKTELLNRLRLLVDGEETTLSISTIKAIQDEWKSIGQVPASQNKNLWASFNALMDRFYDNRSIYFELKELDRKKNLIHKTELCEKAEGLQNIKDLKDAIKALNDLHDEFKHIGPVPRDAQEALWSRFKAASDVIYDRRKDFYDGQKEVFKKNQEEKESLIEKLKLFGDYKADRIKDWNIKTKEILEIQKNWEKIGPVPKESGKEINKIFWASFKQFFQNKNLFFKELDEIRAANQAIAEGLIAKAEELRESNDWQNAANLFMKLQQDWKVLGPTPEKSRDTLYKRFKSACDTFFENRRNSNKASNAEFESNLIKKKEICKQIQELGGTDNPNEEQLIQLITNFNEVGFVPRKNMKEMQVLFKSAVESYLEKLSPNNGDKEDFLFRLNLNKIQSDPNSIKTLNKKEHGIRKQITDLENNVTLWKNNLDFFASSKTADKLRDQFDIKIQKAEEEIDKLKKKLSIIKEF